MTLRHLKVFAEVCDCGGMTKAAEKLHIAQPAISFTVCEFEKYYGIKLFKRVGRELKLTEEGSVLYIKAKQILSQFGELESIAFSASQNPVVNIGFSLTLGKTLLPRLYKSVKKEYPQIELKAAVNSTHIIEEQVVGGALDFAFVEGNITDSSLRVQKFSSDSLVAVCSADYVAENNIGVECGDLRQYNWLLRENGSASRDFFDSELARLGKSVSPVVCSSSNSALISACINGLGIAVLPSALVKENIESGKLKHIALEGINLNRNSFVIYHKNRPPENYFKQIIDMAIQ